MLDGTSLEILYEWRQEVMNLLAAMLQLGRLPNRVEMTIGDLSLHSQKIQYDMRLLNNLQKRCEV